MSSHLRPGLVLYRIISGGQTGADQAGLWAGRELSLQTGGTAPYNWMTESGPKEEFLRGLGLTPAPYDPRTYPIRTLANVRDSDCTVWFGKTGTPGFKATERAVNSLGRLFLINPGSEELYQCLVYKEIQILNVSGNRRSGNLGIEKEVREILVRGLRS